MTVAQERVVLVAGGELRRIRRGDQHMVDVVAGAGVGAGEREGAAGIDDGAAAVADEQRRRSVPAGHDSAAATPLSALNSLIIASQAGARSMSPSQKDCRARAVKSSSGAPCCSTQVKYPRLKIRLRDGAPLFLLRNRRHARRDSMPKMTYTHLP